MISKMALNDLYEYADEHDITVVESHCPECKALSMLSPNGNCYIGIDHKAIKTEREERQYLAHDIGHCIKGAFYNPYSPFSLIEQQEYRANKWAINKLLPKDEMEEAMEQGYEELWELSEYFDVSEDMVKFAFWVYFDIIKER